MIAIVGVIVGCFVASSLAAPSDPVFTLTDQNFDRFLQDKSLMLVDFYAPWCSDCETLKPHFDKAARALGKQNKYVLAKIDCFGEGRFTCANRFGIRQWPTLKVFKFGQFAGDYTGSYSEVAIKAYVNDVINDQPRREYDYRAANGLPAKAQQQYGNECKHLGWRYNVISPVACG